MAGKKGMTGQTGPKHTKTEYEEVLAKVARLDKMGFHQHDIARQVKVSQPQVCVYLATLRERHVRDQSEDTLKAVEQWVLRYQGIYEEAWEEYLRSKNPAMERVEELSKPWRPKDPKTGKLMGKDVKKLVKVRETVTTTGRLGDSRYLDVMIACLKEIAKLKAWYPEKVRTLKGTGMTVPGQDQVDQRFWDMLAGAVKEVEDPIEARIAEAERRRLGHGHATDAQEEAAKEEEAQAVEEVPTLPPAGLG